VTSFPPLPSVPVPPPADRLIEALDAALPQTQCTRCGYPDCRTYAQAIAQGRAEINQCPPGGEEGVRRLSRLTGRPFQPLHPDHGREGPRHVAVIDEDWCIGCTLCIQACPVDSIVGAPKLMHTVIASECTGCELCLPVCPVDCIDWQPVSGERTGWQAWGAPQAERARVRYQFHQTRTRRAQEENDARLAAKAQAKLADLATHSQLAGDAEALARKRRIVEAAMARSQAQRQASAGPPEAPDT
jgi:electron transport complex protein RnfB